VAPRVQAAGALPASNQIPLAAAFGAGVLAGGAAVSLARLRHRQRQGRRPGRRIPLPVSAPVIEAEQRLRAAAPQRPVPALRETLASLGAELVLGGQQVPDVTGVRLLPDSMELLLGSPPAEPPPPPFSVPGGRQGLAWRLSLAGERPWPAAEAGDLLPGLLTIGAVDGGYLLADLEHLQVTTVDGPPELAAAVLGSAAAELATGELSGWYDLILVGFPELAVLGGRGTCCESLDAGLDLLAAKAVVLRRRLGRAARADVRYHRLAEPGDEDWALTLLVSRIPPSPSQLAMLIDLAGEPGGIAALVPGGEVAGRRAPASIELAPEPAAAGGMIARIRPLQLEAWPQPLQDADYRALTSLFAIATDEHDVDPGDPPYDSWSWPADLTGTAGPDDAAGRRDAPADHASAGDDLAGDDLAGDDLAGDDEPADGPAENTPGAGPGSHPADGWAAASGPAEPWRQDAAADQPYAWPEPAGSLAEADDDLADLWTGQISPDAGESDPGQDDGGPAPPWMRPESPETTAAARAGSNGRQPPAAQSGPAKAGAAEPDLSAPPRIGVLGTFTINGQPGALLPAQSQLVLALALNAPGGLSNQQLCHLLGADPDHPKPSDSLRQLLVRTRRQLGRAADGREWIEHLGGGQYALHPEARVDWHEFDSLARRGILAADADCLRKALGLIRGQPFTGCYYWWLDLALTETVRAQIVDAAETLAGLELAAGDPAAAGRAARIGLAGDAGAEQLWRSLMMAEHAAGNLTGVREAWNRCLEVVGELAPDGEPHPRTAALYRDLMAGGGPHTAWAGS